MANRQHCGNLYAKPSALALRHSNQGYTQQSCYQGPLCTRSQPLISTTTLNTRFIGAVVKAGTITRASVTCPASNLTRSQESSVSSSVHCLDESIYL